MAVFSREPFAMYPCDPDPFEATTTIRYFIPSGTDVRLVVQDQNGQPLKQLVDGYRAPGLHTETWDGRDNKGRPARPGTYRCRLVAGPFIDTVELTRTAARQAAAPAGGQKRA